MKADANELCRVGHLLAQVELILLCGWKLDLATPTQVLALVWWKAVHQLRELISLKSKATKGKVLVSFSWWALWVQPWQGEWGLEHGLLGEGGGGSLWLCRLFFSQTCYGTTCVSVSSTTWDRCGCLLVSFQQWNFWTGLVLLTEKDGLVQVVRNVLGNHGEIKFSRFLFK